MPETVCILTQFRQDQETAARLGFVDRVALPSLPLAPVATRSIARRVPRGFASVGAELGADRLFTFPNALTLAGYGFGLWWVVGGPAWAALVSVVVDELDGRIARAMGSTSALGASLDWTTDVVLTAATLQRLRAPVWITMAATLGQVALRDRGIRPTFGSARAGLMLFDVGRAWLQRRGTRAAA